MYDSKTVPLFLTITISNKESVSSNTSLSLLYDQLYLEIGYLFEIAITLFNHYACYELQF
jgi:hypothetical protein